MQGQQRQLYLKYTKTLYKTNKRKIQIHTIPLQNNKLQNNNQISQTELLKLRIKSKFHKKSAKSQNKYLSQYFITNPYVSASAVIDYRLG